jgi:hypothetical protein
MPAIEFTDYARLQMLERELSEALVREALMEPDVIVAGDRGRKVAHERLGPEFRNHLLRVVFEEVDDQWLVITVYTTSKVEKYWRGP